MKYATGPVIDKVATLIERTRSLSASRGEHGRIATSCMLREIADLADEIRVMLKSDENVTERR